MPTATRYDVTKIPAGVIATLWAGLAIPGANARLTIDSDGTPDETENPNAKHLGHTDSGITVSATETVQDFFADELAPPIASSIDTATVSITGTLLQVNDEEVMKVLGANLMTYSTASGYKQLQMGIKASLTNASIAVIWPTPMDPTKFAAFHLYSARSTAGVTFQIGRKTRAGTPFTITGYPITSRASADQFGNYWWQIA